MSPAAKFNVTTNRFLVSLQIKAEPYSGSSMQAMDSSEDDDSCSDEDAASRKRRDMLTRRPSYHKILKEISGPDMSGESCECAKSIVIREDGGWMEGCNPMWCRVNISVEYLIIIN